MAERKGSSVSTLPAELQRQLHFEPDSFGEWLISDKQVDVGGLEFGEWLPARARVSKDGTRFEVGARIEDLEGLLELNRLTHETVRDVESIASFWQDNLKFSSKVEEGWLFIGANIEPTMDGLEREYTPVNFAYYVALAAALRGETYEQMLADEARLGGMIENIQKIDRNSSTGLFKRPVPKRKRQKEQAGSVCEPRPLVTADDLRDFPLDSYRTSLHGMPGTLVKDGVTKELKNMWVIAHNGVEDVEIIDSHSEYNRETREWIHDDTRLQLPIPEGVEIKTVADLAKLKSVRVPGDKGNVSKEMTVRVEVAQNSFRISSEDGTFDLEVRTSACSDCQLPYWKFRWPEPEEIPPFGRSPEFSMHSLHAGGARGSYDCWVQTEEGSKLYCIDCVKKLEAAYLEEHPNARKSEAIKLVRDKLDLEGYSDVQIREDQVWRSRNDGWEMITYIEYQRDGRTIRRHTGTPVILDTGEFEEFSENMQSREYIDFRDKTA